MDSAKVLATYNIASYVFESLRPTPELSFAVRHFHCFGGIMVTASHNPKEYNGYKLYDELGCQLVPALAQQVIDRVNAVEDELAIKAEPTAEQEKQIQSFLHVCDALIQQCEHGQGQTTESLQFDCEGDRILKTLMERYYHHTVDLNRILTATKC